MDRKGLRAMNKQELIIWCFGAKVKDLNDILKAEDIKGLSKLKKADKIRRERNNPKSNVISKLLIFKSIIIL